MLCADLVYNKKEGTWGGDFDYLSGYGGAGYGALKKGKGKGKKGKGKKGGDNSAVLWHTDGIAAAKGGKKGKASSLTQVMTPTVAAAAVGSAVGVVAVAATALGLRRRLASAQSGQESTPLL
jgi:hypothetical protein